MSNSHTWVRRQAKLGTLGLGAACLMLLSACDEPDVVLGGVREPLRAQHVETGLAENSGENSSVAVSLAKTTNNASWTQRHGSPHTRISHPAFGGSMQMLWSANIGAGDSKHGRVTADPIVAQGKVFTLDSEARVSATSTGGGTVWSVDLVPERESSRDATGGGLAYADGKVFVSSGFGLLSALDAKSGAVIWQQKLEATGSGNPTVRDGIVYLVAGDATAWAVDADSGRILWQLGSTADKNNIMGGPAPAVNDQLVVFSFGNGEMQAAFRQGGLRLWDAVISGQRRGFARSRISDITGDPVIVGTKLYAGTHSGRMVALDAGTGKRIWTAEEGPMSPVWVAGGSVFLVSDSNELVRLSAETGNRIWGAKLPFFVKDKPKRQREVFAHYGPVMAGGRLYVASNDGVIRAFDPRDGSLIGQAEIPGGATTSPVFAGGVMYVVGSKGQLFAFR